MTTLGLSRLGHAVVLVFGLLLPQSLLLAASAHLPDDDIQNGIVIDATITPFGHELARRLAAHWLLDEPPLQANVTISEKPSPLRGSLIEVTSQGQRLYSQHHHIRRANLEQTVGQLVEAIDKGLLALELRALVASPDLHGDGF